LVSMARHAIGLAFEALGNAEGAEIHFRRALEAWDRDGPGATYLVELATLAAGRDPTEARRWIDEALRTLRDTSPDPPAELYVRKVEGWLYSDLPRGRERAQRAFDRALELAEALGRRREVGFVRGQRGLLRNVFFGDPEGAREDLDVAVDEMIRQGDRFQEGAARSHRAVVRFVLDDFDGVSTDVAEARRALGDRAGPRSPLLDQLELAVAAIRENRPTSASATPIDDDEQRLVQDHLAAWFAREAEAWVVDPNGSWVQAPDGTRHAYVAATHPRIVSALVEARIEAPGTGLSVADLTAAGWPDEQVTARAASTRVRVALTALRKAGLRPLLLRGEAGWFLDPDVPLRWARPASSLDSA
ncbi:MAG: hypothetical protein AAF602_07235, partial [Myxococcota bacterium]